MYGAELYVWAFAVAAGALVAFLIWAERRSDAFYGIPGAGPSRRSDTTADRTPVTAEPRDADSAFDTLPSWVNPGVSPADLPDGA